MSVAYLFVHENARMQILKLFDETCNKTKSMIGILRAFNLQQKRENMVSHKGYK